MEERYILFDLDGTLTDPALGITNSILYALHEMKEFLLSPELPPRESLYRFIGPPLSDAFSEFFPKEKVQTAIDTYRVYFRSRGMFENTVYEGIPALLAELKNKGIPTAVATSKPEEFAITILDHFKLSQYFTVIGGADMEGLRGEKPQVIAHVLKTLGISPQHASSCIMVGDRKFDMEGAKAFGMTAAGVTWGYGSRDELLSAGSDHIADTPAELLQILLSN